MYSINPPAFIISFISSAKGVNEYFLFVVKLVIIFEFMSTLTLSPSFISAHASSLSKIGNPMLIAFLKNILAKLFAITQEIPNALIDIGACSLEDQQPKLSPATITSPSLTLSTKSLSMSSMQ